MDIATAAYVAELGYLANPVSTHIQSAEMHNQAVNSLALISARATINSLEVLSNLTASYLYVICQALDLRVLQKEFHDGLVKIISEEIDSLFGSLLSDDQALSLKKKASSIMYDTFNATSTMDTPERMKKIAASSTTLLLDFFTGPSLGDSAQVTSSLCSIPSFRARVTERLASLLDDLRRDYLSGAKGPAPASRYLNKTRPIYEFVRVTLGIRMHGSENYHNFEKGPGVEDVTVGQNVSLIHEAIRDGKMHSLIVSLFPSS